MLAIVSQVEAHPPWIGDRPPGQADHVEARDASGNVLHTAAPPTWDASPDPR